MQKLPANQPMPLGTYAINKEDKKKIREFGGKLDVWIKQQCKEHDIPMRVVMGSFDYVNSLIEARIRFASDYYNRLSEVVSQKDAENLVAKMEAFQDDEEPKQGLDTASNGTPPPVSPVKK